MNRSFRVVFSNPCICVRALRASVDSSVYCHSLHSRIFSHHIHGILMAARRCRYQTQENPMHCRDNGCHHQINVKCTGGADKTTMHLTFGIVHEKKKNHIDDADSFRTKQIVRSNENISVCYRDRDSSCRSIAYVTANYQIAEDIDLCASLLISAMNGVTAKVSFFTIWMVK